CEQGCPAMIQQGMPLAERQRVNIVELEGVRPVETCPRLVQAVRKRIIPEKASITVVTARVDRFGIRVAGANQRGPNPFPDPALKAVISHVAKRSVLVQIGGEERIKLAASHTRVGSRWFEVHDLVHVYA